MVCKCPKCGFDWDDDRRSRDSEDRFLYRYYGNIDYVLDVLNEKRLRHSLPSEFNDPFDCKTPLNLRYDENIDDNVYKNVLLFDALMQHPNVYRYEVEKIADEWFRKGKHKDGNWYRELMCDLGDGSLAELVRICCFTRSARNMPMWNCYANKHKGVVFQFRGSKVADAGSGECRRMFVSYVNKPLDVRDLEASLKRYLETEYLWDHAQFILGTKTEEWSYEDEIRSFTLSDREYLSFREEALPRIIFGANCEKENFGKVMEAIRTWKIKPRLFKASCQMWNRKLVIEPL